MSLNEYKEAEKILRHTPFYSFIMAAMIQADDNNLRLLREAWPDVYAEVHQRYNNRGGLLDDEDEEV